VQEKPPEGPKTDVQTLLQQSNLYSLSPQGFPPGFLLVLGMGFGQYGCDSFFFFGGGVALEAHVKSFIYSIWKKIAPNQLRLNYTAKRLGKNKKPSKSTRF